jgi:NAD(P)-dependent dehydrogenase (short-subunit alcohol dehydrogenase family)
VRVNLKGKVAVVTGSGRGIGRTTALSLAENGATVVVNCDHPESEGRGVVSEVEELGREAIFVKADVGDVEQVKNLFEQTINAFGRVDILVNNAGIGVRWDGRLPIQAFREAEWDRIINVDLKGVFLCSQRAAQEMIRQGRGGKIVNISSVAGIMPLRLQSAYVAAKAGVINLTRGMALELAPHNINVNTVAPGSMENVGWYANPEQRELAESVLSHIPLRRPGKFIEIANAVLFLASDASSYVTGSTIVVDGGWSVGYMRDW